MRKLILNVMLCSLFACFFWGISLIKDRKTLNSGLIRFHVVANSDRQQDQDIKLKIRDAVLADISEDLKNITDINDARIYLQESLPKIQLLVDQTLDKLGCQDSSTVTLCREAFDIRHYDTFSLPAGIYESLRIVIGEGKGKNWWCVSFPSLCLPATASGFTEKAVSAGFSEPLTEALSGNEDYQIRFYFLNQLGKLENILFQE